jgi:hypothetical protein
MKKRFLLAATIISAATAFAQDAPAPAQDAGAAAAAPEAAAVAQPAAEAPAEQPAEQEAAAPVAEAQPAAQPAEEATAAPAEESKPAQEEAKAASAEEPKAEEKSEDKGEVAAAAGSALDVLKSSMSEGTSEANMEVKYSGEVEFDVYSGDLWNDDDVKHSYASTFDLNFEVKFNEKWSAFVGLEADGESTDPAAIYNGAYIQYQPAEIFTVKVGDLTSSEGAFVAYYGYDDPADNAAGMKEHDIRGIQVQLAGLELGLGFGRGDNDAPDTDANGNVYDVHAAYELEFAGQHLRPYADYKSYQETQHNELHAGVEAGLSIGGFSFRAVYGFHGDYLMDDGDVAKGQDWTSTAHAFLVEPSFELGMFEIKTTAFYAMIDRGDAADGASDLDSEEIPEYFFAYAEPALKLAEYIKLGIPVEYHTNTLDDDDDTQTTFDVGGRIYITPVENLEITAFGMVDIPVADNEDDNSLWLGVETVFSF